MLVERDQQAAERSREVAEPRSGEAQLDDRLVKLDPLAGDQLSHRLS